MTQPHASSQLVMMKKTDEFSSVFSFRKRYGAHFLVIHYQPNQKSTCRVGFVVAKKIAKQAVKRNYMRRVLRELCRQQLSMFETNQLDLVIQVIKPFRQADFLQVKQDLTMLFARIQRKMAQAH